MRLIITYLFAIVGIGLGTVFGDASAVASIPDLLSKHAIPVGVYLIGIFIGFASAKLP